MPTKDPEKQKEYRRRHYEKDPERTKAKVRARKEALRAEVEVLKAAPCTDCGRTFPPECMDFDHIDATSKTLDVGTLVCNGGRQRVLAEIAKCELVCACCHRIRTRKRYSAGGLIKYT